MCLFESQEKDDTPEACFSADQRFTYATLIKAAVILHRLSVDPLNYVAFVNYLLITNQALVNELKTHNS